jgi:hypothetical protein
VCIDYGRGVESGGDFAFASIGAVLKCKHCNVLIYNPTHHHGSTEFSSYPDETTSGHLFFAFFMKKNVLRLNRLLVRLLFSRMMAMMT